MWKDLNLIAIENHIADSRPKYALRFMLALTRRLQVTAENILTAFDKDAPATEPAGYILPIRRRQLLGVLRWSSQWWFVPIEYIVLSPGDSPMCYRIPDESDALDCAR